MDKKVKYYLKNIIKESLSTDVDEMARVTRGVRDDKNKDRVKKFKALFSKDNQTTFKNRRGEIEGVPDAWEINGVPIIMFSDCEDFEDKVRSNEELQTLLKEFEERGLTMSVVKCSTPKAKLTPGSIFRLTDKPRSVDLGTSYAPSGKKQSIELSNKKNIFALLRNYLINDTDFLKESIKRGIPFYKFEEKNLDEYEGRTENDDVLINVHSVRPYGSLEELFDTTLSRLDGDIDVKDELDRTTEEARQYNQKYKNWDIDRIFTNTYEGLTKKYKLNKVGLRELNFSAGVRLDFTLKGTMDDENNYTWESSINVSFRVKKLNDYSVGNYKKIFRDSSMVTVNVTEYDENKPLFNNNDIVNGLVDCIQELKSKILEVPEEKILETVTLDVHMMSSSPEEINENKKINFLVNSVIKELKNKSR
jgi:hypothetical protein